MNHRNLFEKGRIQFAAVIVLSAAALSVATDVHAQADYRIGIRTTDGVARFYDKQTGADFTPRGNNYLELRPDPTNTFVISSLFFPAYHDTAEIESDFERMQALGYNTARIFVDLCSGEDCIASASGGLRDDYMDNIVELLQIARRYEVYVLLTANWLPDVGGYSDAHLTCEPNFYGGNCLLLSAEGVNGYRNFFRDFVQGLHDRNAPVDIILGYQLRNEAFLENNSPPLNKASGTVTSANGLTYDMGNAEDKERMVEDGLIYWANETREVIRSVAPNALVTAGFFAPSAPHDWRPNDYRVVRTNGVLRDSNLDFLDFHLYQEVGLTVAQQAENFGMSGYNAKPIIMGEFGVFRHQFETPAPAADVLQTWQADACAAGFDGYLLWQWDPINSTLVGDNVWGPHHGTGEIARALAPVFHPDPCEDNAIRNLTRDRPAFASRSLGGSPASNVTDGNHDVGWGAGDYPEQWIEVDLGQPEQIGRLALLVDQSPSGATVHQVLGRATSSDSYTLLHEFSSVTDYGQWLEVSPSPAWENVGWLRILTTASPSWVGWLEIEAYSPDNRNQLPLPPAQTSPENYSSESASNVVLQWEVVPGATTYDVHVATDAAFVGIVADRAGLDATRVDTGVLPDNDIYHWRVRAHNDDGDGPWSATRQFSVGDVTAIEAEFEGVRGFRSYPIYPNPATDATTFRFDLLVGLHVRIAVYDVLGREVVRLADGWRVAGEHSVKWEPDPISPGVYYWRIEVGAETELRAVVLLR